MEQLSDIVSRIVALYPGQKVVGKTRLQKIVFLLDECSLGSGSRYSYHYYGPFSPEIAEAAEDACELGLLKYREQHGFHSVPYGVYELANPSLDIPALLGDLPANTVKEKLNIMDEYTAIDLEIAATIRYLRTMGTANAAEQVTMLKPAKASVDRIRRAQELLRRLGL